LLSVFNVYDDTESEDEQAVVLLPLMSVLKVSHAFTARNMQTKRKLQAMANRLKASVETHTFQMNNYQQQYMAYWINFLSLFLNQNLQQALTLDAECKQ
jgi:hypothetical protein